MPNKFRTGLVPAIVLAALTGGNTAFADPVMPYFGLVSGQSATGRVTNPLRDFSCSVQIGLVDTQGNLVTQTEGSAVVAPGGSTALGINGPEGGRAEYRPVFSFTPPSRCARKALVSAEVMDATGVTRVFWPSDPVLSGPSKPVQSGLITLSQGQTARLIGVNLWPPSPIKLMLRFLDAAGMVLSSQSMTVAPNTSATLDFTLPSGYPPNPVRYEVSVVSSPSPAMSFHASSEIFDSTTGATTVAWPPVPVFGDN